MNTKAEIEDKVGRMNARAVIQRMEEMQVKIDAQDAKIAQLVDMHQQLLAQMQLQQTLAVQIAKHGNGPTV